MSACELDRRIAEVLAGEFDRPVPPSVQAVAEAARKAYGDGILAVLFYGSCFRSGEDRGGLVDLYLLAESYRSVHSGWLARLANRLVPPNVYHVECAFEGRRVHAKCALVTLDQFCRRSCERCRNPYFWARFSQPFGLLWVRDEEVRRRIERARIEAIRTTWRAARPLLPGRADPLAIWQRAYRETYRTELRAEKPERARQLVERFADRFTALGRLLEGVACEVPRRHALRTWRLRRIEGKLLSVLRLLKAAFTFRGGADYLAWKIERHSGVRVELSDWQRRHPVLASLVLGWRLYRRRAFR